MTAERASYAADERTTLLGVWLFLASEGMLLGAAIVAFLIYRHLHRTAFAAASAALDAPLGTINTAVLLTSSMTAALATNAAAGGRTRRTGLLLAASALLGTVFLGAKAIEYADDIAAGLLPAMGLGAAPGIAPSAGTFLSFYWGLTGLHALHVLVGVVLLGTLALGCARPRAPRPHIVEGVVLYWHFVDIVWVFLFPLFYLSGARTS